MVYIINKIHMYFIYIQRKILALINLPKFSGEKIPETIKYINHNESQLRITGRKHKHTKLK